jgi:hypothetical protein
MQVVAHKVHNLVLPRLIVWRVVVIAWTVCVEVFLAVAHLLDLVLVANQAQRLMKISLLVLIVKLVSSRQTLAMIHVPRAISTAATQPRERLLAPVRLGISPRMVV